MIEKLLDNIAPFLFCVVGWVACLLVCGLLCELISRRHVRKAREAHEQWIREHHIVLRK